MAIMATDTGGGGDFSPMPSGNHLAICNMVIDLGKQRINSQQFGESVKHQVYLRWETPHEQFTWTDKDGNERTGPMRIGKTYTLSLHENATLRAHLENWRGKAFTEDERKGFDIAKLIGVPCMVNVIHEDRNGKTYANVTGIGAFPKGMEKPETAIGLTVYDPDNPGTLEFLPDWLQKKINEQVRDQVKASQGSESWGDQLDDDIPF